MDDCRAEAERVYRDARSGRIPPQAGTRFIYMLGQIAAMIETQELEARLRALEDHHEQT